MNHYDKAFSIIIYISLSFVFLISTVLPVYSTSYNVYEIQYQWNFPSSKERIGNDQNVLNDTQTESIVPLAPLKQLELRWSNPSVIKCKENYELIFRYPNAAPLCTSNDTAKKLMQRGFATDDIVELYRFTATSSPILDTIYDDAFLDVEKKIISMNYNTPTIEFLDQNIKVILTPEKEKAPSPEQKLSCIKSIQEYVYPFSGYQYGEISGTIQVLEQRMMVPNIIIQINGKVAMPSPLKSSDHIREKEDKYQFTLKYNLAHDQCELVKGNYTLRAIPDDIIKKASLLAEQHPIINYYSQRYDVVPDNNFVWIDEKRQSLLMSPSWYNMEPKTPILGLVLFSYDSSNLRIVTYVDLFRNEVFIENIATRPSLSIMLLPIE